MPQEAFAAANTSSITAELEGGSRHGFASSLLVNVCTRCGNDAWRQNITSFQNLKAGVLIILIIFSHTKSEYRVYTLIILGVNTFDKQAMRRKHPAYSNSQEPGEHEYIRGFRLRGD